jgi:hypothetical protein
MYNEDMRTTIEMKPDHRAKLLELAASRGEKGFSCVVEEAIDLLLTNEVDRKRDLREALAVRGSLSKKEGEALREHVSQLRESWR